MWVNSEKYVFSDHVVSGGLKLYAQFEQIFSLVDGIYKSCEDTFDYLTIERLNLEIPK